MDPDRVGVKDPVGGKACKQGIRKGYNPSWRRRSECRPGGHLTALLTAAVPLAEAPTGAFRP